MIKFLYKKFLKFGLGLIQPYKTCLKGKRCITLINMFSDHISSDVRNDFYCAKRNKLTALTCILPISNAKSTNPRVATTIATIISPIKVLVRRPCPKELHPPNRKVLILKHFFIISIF